MNVIIFTEGGTVNGFGHISRCSALYDELLARGLEVELIINTDLKKIGMLADRTYRIANWLSISYLKEVSFDKTYCIIDSYVADMEILEYLELNSIKCMYIDDYNRLNYPKGITLNPSLNEEFVCQNKKNRIGGKDYIILRKEFHTSINRTVNKRAKNVLVTLGGSDSKGLTNIILEKVIPHFSTLSFDIVVGNNDNIAQFIKRNPIKNVTLIENASANEMRRLMEASDFTITAAGQTIYELIVTKTPFIPIKTAENQSDNIKGLLKFNIVNNVIDSEDFSWFENLIYEINNLENYNNRLEVSHKSKGLVDGKGCARIINRLLE
ncbi:MULTISPECIES: PseG/SpsG family protein [Exiguobacterium]|uniref:PseG/SpsG family protein n=1 Tax=Exiguobacterium TaxID=33986 RepID=UPI001BEB022A|nr:MULTISPECIES: hypothetical protein [Exiguobacterium]MCT4784101.1 hypothetical protein [Exiguobacterium himgiriensis]